MHIRWWKAATLLAVFGVGPARLEAQFDFTLGGRSVQIHSFASQGFALSNGNNYLTMQTGRGSFEMTDLGVNLSIQLTDKFRIGVQGYDRDIGNLGQWHPQLDWAVADYRFTDWLGIRGGVVKTVFGLDSDTQDMEFLHTFALLPQSVYPTDLRDALIRHRGGDLYGEIPLRRWGSLSYTVYAGLREDNRYGGYPYLLSSIGLYLTSYGGLQVGEDMRWRTPLKGLLIGASHMGAGITGVGSWDLSIGFHLPYTIRSEEHSKRDWTDQFYGRYTAGNWQFQAEYRRYWRDQIVFNGTTEIKTDLRSWYGSAAYRISRWLELGAYYSRWVAFWSSNDPNIVQPPNQSSPDRHQYDKAVTARIDLNRHWNIKVEGHFIDGTGIGSSGFVVAPIGFYPQDNPQGLQPRTNLLLIRTGWNF